MDFANRGTRPAGTEPASVGQSAGNRGSRMKESKVSRILVITMLFLVTAVGVSLLALLIFGGKSTEASYVKKDKYQAVFLNGGQVYFGKIGKYDTKFLTLSDIYYLRVNQQVQPGQTQASNDVSLAKLGNELHGPEDSMVINRTEVQFWENLKDDGQVVKAITAYKKDPSAANAATPSTQQSSGNQQQTNTTPTTPAPATTKKP